MVIYHEIKMLKISTDWRNLMENNLSLPINYFFVYFKNFITYLKYKKPYLCS